MTEDTSENVVIHLIAHNYIRWIAMNSPIGWIGGKRALRQEIIALFPQDGVGRYIEVFFGAGWVFLKMLFCVCLLNILDSGHL